MERLKTPHYQVTAAIIVGDGKILITQRPYHDAFGGLWEFPGGKQEQGESLEQCLVREIYEELAVTIQIHEHLFSITHRYEKVKISLHFYLCTIRDGTPTCKEVQDWKWVDFSEMNRYEFTEADREVIEKLRELKPNLQRASGN